MSKPGCIALAAGGTGGHVFPAEALAHELEKRGYKTVLVTDHRGEPLSANFPRSDKLVLTAASPNPRQPLKFVRAIGLLGLASLKAGKFLKEHQVTHVIGFGGYPSVPALSAGARLKLPLILHEQNAVLGRSNRLFAGRATWIASGFDRLQRLPETARSRHVVTGNPLRPDIAQAASLPYPDIGEDLQLLVLGGSLGARIISEALPPALALLSPDLAKRIHLTAQITQDQLEIARPALDAARIKADIAPFFDNIAKLLTRAHLVVGRAGASSVAEFSALGKPSILIPLKIAMDDHQTGNAQALKDVGAADIISEEALTPEKLAALLQARLSDPDDLRYRSGLARSLSKANAASLLADLVEKV
jgi:UDP-N-acetylglucosamine--N-acetylmuramyl-(pentapeptide) pyrophosphoryl-undecaprenol N-acetylglucosamine transferase